MKTYAFYFAHFTKTPCNSCLDLPKHKKHEAVTVLSCKSKTEDEAYSKLKRQAYRKGFRVNNHISFFCKE
jgi:hypothetical protein